MKIDNVFADEVVELKRYSLYASTPQNLNGGVNE
jgi:hypothetical protein